jgi:hypothetical protein
VIEDYKVELKRVEYDVEHTLATIDESALSEDDREMLKEVFRRGASVLNNGQKGA